MQGKFLKKYSLILENKFEKTERMPPLPSLAWTDDIYYLRVAIPITNQIIRG